MPVKIRLARRGRKRQSKYAIVVADSRAPRDGKFIEKLGYLDRTKNPSIYKINTKSSLKWLLEGAQPTPSARSILSDAGLMFKRHLLHGVLKGKRNYNDILKEHNEWLRVKKEKKIQSFRVQSMISQEIYQEVKLKELTRSKANDKTEEFKIPTLELSHTFSNNELNNEVDHLKLILDDNKSDTFNFHSHLKFDIPKKGCLRGGEPNPFKLEVQFEAKGNESLFKDTFSIILHTHHMIKTNFDGYHRFQFDENCRSVFEFKLIPDKSIIDKSTHSRIQLFQNSFMFRSIPLNFKIV